MTFTYLLFMGESCYANEARGSVKVNSDEVRPVTVIPPLRPSPSTRTRPRPGQEQLCCCITILPQLLRSDI